MAASTSVSSPLLEAHALRKVYVTGRGVFSRGHQHVVLEDVTLAVAPGSITAIVGESGSGKSTLARCLARLEEPTSGEVRFEGNNPWQATGAGLLHMRRKIQLILQDTGTALNPRFTAEEVVSEPLFVQKIGTAAERREKALRVMEEAGIPARSASRYPGEFSGGQRQRLAIARALVLEPKLLILDEALSGLDLSVQAQVLQLLQQLRSSHGLTFVLISHDLGLVGRVADEIAVLDRGRVVEKKAAARLLAAPEHSKTQALVAAMPGRALWQQRF
jgi:ABC-type glutathione transport system ATPase component